MPPGGFAAGVNGVSSALGAAAIGDARAAGFDTVRVFLRWDRIETVEGAPDWSCRYVAEGERGPRTDRGQTLAARPGVPCTDVPCGCGYSADERVAVAAGGATPPAIVLTIVGTPVWARGERARSCPATVPGRALPLGRDKESAFRDFVAAAARRYGARAYAFELWNEPDLALCQSWAGTQRQYRDQILSAATAVKQSGAEPGVVVAPTLESPTGAAMDAWTDPSAPIDVLSFNLYTRHVRDALVKIDEMADWCRRRRHCPGFYVTEFGAGLPGPSSCPGPHTGAPGAADVAIMKHCRRRRACRGVFLFALSDQSERPECGKGLLDAIGCRKGRLCTIARRFFGTATLPFTCAGCGP